MSQFDLETLFRVGSGRKVACETVIEPGPDIPAESFCLPIQDEIDWVDRNAVFDRKQSTKGISITIPIPNSNSNSNSNSKRFYSNLKSKASIIGLPKRPDSRQLCRPFRRSIRQPSVRFFPKPAGKRTEPEIEPSSPKVSCIGRVRSKKVKDCHRNRRSEGNSITKPEKVRLGFWERFVAVFRCQQRIEGGGWVEESKSESAEEFSPVKNKIPATVGHIPTEGAAPGLGGLKKFSSGRRSMEMEMDVHVAESKPLNLEDLPLETGCGPTARTGQQTGL